MTELTSAKPRRARGHGKTARMTRDIHPMPEKVREALNARGLMDRYHARPMYQQNDYVGWISSAKREATREKRLAQMLDELEGGTSYMRMAWGETDAPDR